MTLATRYKQSRFRKVTLSTGDIIEVRPFNRADYIAIGEIPAILLSKEGRAKLEDAENGEREKLVLENLAFFERQLKVTLENCIVTPGFKVVVDKPASECAEDEIHYSQIADSDSAAILSAVMEASGGGRKEAADAATFRGEQNPAPDAGSAGPAIRVEPCLANS